MKIDKIDVGDVLSLMSFTETDERMQLTYSAGKNRRYVALILGDRANNETVDPEKMMNDLGWFRKDTTNEN